MPAHPRSSRVVLADSMGVLLLGQSGVSHVYPGAGFSGVTAFNREAQVGRGRAFGKEVVALASSWGCRPLGRWANHILPLILGHARSGGQPLPETLFLAHLKERCSLLP